MNPGNFLDRERANDGQCHALSLLSNSLFALFGIVNCDLDRQLRARHDFILDVAAESRNTSTAHWTCIDKQTNRMGWIREYLTRTQVGQ